MTHRSGFRLLLALVLVALPLTDAAAQLIGFDRDDFNAPAGARGIVAADLNGDGWVDLATANTQPGTLAVLLNRGAAGGFALARTVWLGGGPFEIAAGDFDKDGRVDLAVANADRLPRFVRSGHGFAPRRAARRSEHRTRAPNPEPRTPNPEPEPRTQEPPEPLNPMNPVFS